MTAVQLEGVKKIYKNYKHGLGRIAEIVFGVAKHNEFTALQSTTLEISKGEIVGIVGANGAGKSTLLKIIAGTLQPSEGEILINGRVAALLELGSGFHPELTGAENIFLQGAVSGLSKSEISKLYPFIVSFSGLEDYINRPIKTYSSGMVVRLAFSVATSINPDILIIDEALSVGDGAFARKSFEKIKSFRDNGKTIIFCSHSLYQIEAICSRAIWINQGRIMLDSTPADVVTTYSDFIDRLRVPGGIPTASSINHLSEGQKAGKIRCIYINGVKQPSEAIRIRSQRDDLVIDIRFWSDPTLPLPTIGVALTTKDGRIVASNVSLFDRFFPGRKNTGDGVATVTYPKISLLKGRYNVQIYLASEDALFGYDEIYDAGEFVVEQDGLEQGLVYLQHEWADFVDNRP